MHTIREISVDMRPRDIDGTCVVVVILWNLLLNCLQELHTDNSVSMFVDISAQPRRHPMLHKCRKLFLWAWKTKRNMAVHSIIVSLGPYFVAEACATCPFLGTPNIDPDMTDCQTNSGDNRLCLKQSIFWGVKYFASLRLTLFVYCLFVLLSFSGVVVLTAFMNIFRVRTIGLKSIFVMVSVCMPGAWSYVRSI